MNALARRLEWSAALAGLGLAALIVRQAQDPTLVAILVTVSVGIVTAWIAVQDLRAFTISDSAILTIAILALAYRWSSALLFGEPMLATALSTGIDAVLPGGLLLAFREIYYRLKGVDGLGLGDVKLAAAGGLLVGAVGFSWALLAASLFALGYVGLSHVTRRDGPLGKTDKLAFGAILAPALWTVWVAEQLPMLLPFLAR